MPVDFSFGNMNTPVSFVLEMRCRAGEKPANDSLADGIGMEGLHDHLTVRAALSETLRELETRRLF